MAKTLLSVMAVLVCAVSVQAQVTDTSKLVCPDEIPAGIRVIRLPDAEQQKVVVSDFSVAVNKDTSYDLTMNIMNGSDSWCVTSLGIAYLFEDARGQEWVANEYPAVKRFTMKADAPVPPKGQKSAAPSPAPHSVGLMPGQDETRVLFDVYFYIQPRPVEHFDGFHIVSAEIKSCLATCQASPISNLAAFFCDWSRRGDAR